MATDFNLFLLRFLVNRIPIIANKIIIPTASLIYPGRYKKIEQIKKTKRSIVFTFSDKNPSNPILKQINPDKAVTDIHKACQKDALWAKKIIGE